MTMDLGGYIKRLWRGCRRYGCDSSFWGWVPFGEEGDRSAEVAELRRCGVAPERIFVGGDFRDVLASCREDDTLLVYLSEDASAHRDLLRELLLEATHRKVNFRAVGAYGFEIGHEERLLCDYLLLHTLLEELYARVSQEKGIGVQKCRCKC